MNKDKTMPIAIIGMGCRLPGGSNTPERLWQLCAEGKNTWSTIPSERFNQKSFYHSKPETLGTFNAKGAHFLNEDVSEWDASFFNFTASMAKSMDPQLRVLLETVFEALESAGLPLEEIAGSRTSVFAGTCFKDYHDMLMRDQENLPRYMLSGNLTTMISNRISHFFNLRGPSVSVDTACSTGLTALHLVCQSLRTGESKMSIIGGANLLLHPSAFCSLSNLGLLGDDGKPCVFNRRLRVETAYHSHHMDPIALAYLVDLEKSLRITRKSLTMLFTSPVSGDVVEHSCQVGSRHWVRNMVQCVLFDDCLQKMILSKNNGADGQVSTNNVDILVEIGPHAALAAPIRQILSLPDIRIHNIRYASCLTRDQDAMKTMQELAGFLFSCGYPVLLQDVNFPQGQIRPRVIHNLPPYHWNHSKKNWAAPLQVQEMFHREFARHELLGVRVEGLSPDTPIWRNTLRAVDLPWDVNQVPCPTVVFNNMVMEAMRQIMGDQDTSSAGFEIYDMKMLNVIVVPSNSDGLPIQLTLNRKDLIGNKDEFDFSIDSQMSYNEWTKHCVGRVGMKGQTRGKIAGVDDQPYLIEGLDSVSSDTELGLSHEVEKSQRSAEDNSVARRDSAVCVTPEQTLSPEPGNSSVRDLIAEATTDEEIREVVLNAIQEKIMTIFMPDEDDFDIHRSLMDYGVDSLVAVELHSWIAAHLTVETRFVDIMESSTVLNLVEKIVSKIV